MLTYNVLQRAIPIPCMQYWKKGGDISPILKLRTPVKRLSSSSPIRMIRYYHEVHEVHLNALDIAFRLGMQYSFHDFVQKAECGW